MSQGRARAANALGAAGGAPPPRAIRRSPAGGRCRPRSACPAYERPPSARLSLGRRRPPLHHLRSAAETGPPPPARPSAHVAAPRGPVRPRAGAAPRGRVSFAYGQPLPQRPPERSAGREPRAAQDLARRRSRSGSPRSAVGRTGRGCVASPELMETVLVGLE